METTPAFAPNAIDIDPQKLKAFMRLKPTLADTAAFFQCSERTIESHIRRLFDMTFFDFREQNMVHTRASLIRKAIQMAENGNVPMLIFSLKNLCGWKDKQEVSLGEEEKAIFNMAYPRSPTPFPKDETPSV